MRFVAVVNVLARVLVLFAASMTLPWGISFLLDDGAGQAFGWSLAATLGAALLLWLATFRERRELQVRDAASPIQHRGSVLHRRLFRERLRAHRERGDGARRSRRASPFAQYLARAHDLAWRNGCDRAGGRDP